MSKLDLGTWDKLLDLFATGAFNFEDLQKWTELIEYQGLDPEIIFKEIMSIGIKNGWDSTVLRNDMFKIVLFAGKRGTNFNGPKFEGRSKKEENVDAAKDVADLMKKWDVHANLGGTPSNKKITVARVVAVFPEIMAALLATEIVKPMKVQAGLDRCFHFPSGCALMTDEEWGLQSVAFLDFMTDFNEVVTRKAREKDKKKWDAVAARAQQENIAKATRSAAFTKRFLYPKRKQFNIYVAALINTFHAKSNVKPVVNKMTETEVVV